MLNIAHLDIVCQDHEEIPVETGDIYRDPADAEPVATPLADLLAASDPAAMDAEVMSLTIWLETWEPMEEWVFWEEEVTT
jgi:hypothetical protein